MTTINNQEDFLRALRENPEWKDAVRAQILGDELLKLPIQFNEFKDRMEKFEVRMEQFVERQEEFNQRQEEFNRNVVARFDEVDARFDGVDQFIERQEAFNRNVTARFDRMEGDISTVKGGHARSVGRESAGIIAADLEMEYVRTLTQLELDRIYRQAAGRLTTNELRSFRAADLVIEAVQDSETVYIPVEISFTADRRDSDRALRNAELLTRFTGRRAVATVASVRNDQHVAGLVESHALHWHELDEKYLEVK